MKRSRRTSELDSALAALRHYVNLSHDGLLARQSTSRLDSALAALRHYVTLSHDGLFARQSTSKLDSALAALRHYVTLSHDGLLARQSTSKLDSALAALRHCQGVIVNHYIAVYTDYQVQKTPRSYFCQGVPLPLGRAKQLTETLNDAAS